MRSKQEKVIAIFCADLHLSLTAPIWRSNEPDWFAAMKRPLDYIKEVQAANDGCPVLCAGDIFHRWNASPELINFAMRELPNDMYCVPGQHDLPLHNFDDIRKSAYWTLVSAGVIRDISSGEMILHNNRKIVLTGFPFGYEIKKAGDKKNITFPETINIAIAHEYCWIKGCNYPGASKENELGYKATMYNDTTWKGYDVVVYGDNHKGFTAKNSSGKTTFFNCGSLMCRHSDQLNYTPQIGLLLESGKVGVNRLDIHEDKFLELKENDDFDTTLNMKEFIQELEKLGNTDLDFTEAMKQYLKKNSVRKTVQNIILNAIGV